MSESSIQNQIIKATEIVVGFKTTADEPQQQQACLEEIAKMFATDFTATFHSFHGHPALVLSTHATKESDVIISGHIDVVPGGDDLFTTKQEGSKLVGRGVYDMKGPLMAALHAARDVAQKNSNKRISVLITADEETDGRGTQALLAQEGYRATFAIIPDGGDENHIVTAQKGFSQLAITMHGTSTHASRPWGADNPIIKIALFLEMLAKRFPNPEGIYDWKTSITPTKITGGTILNQTPDQATVYLDIRFTSDEDINSLTKWITDTFHDEVSIATVTGNGMFRVDENNLELHKLKLSLEKQTGTKIEFTRECGTSDAIFFTGHGIPAALFRPKGGDDHGNHEWVDIESLQKVYATIYDYLISS